jgi:hypothetical protein
MLVDFYWTVGLFPRRWNFSQQNTASYAALCWFLAWLTLAPRRWRWNVPLKVCPAFKLHSVVTYKIELFIVNHCENLKCNRKYGIPNLLILSCVASLTGGDRSIGIVRLWTKTTEGGFGNFCTFTYCSSIILYLSILLHSILYTSMLPPKCNIYFTIICSFTQHVSATVNHHQVYFTLLKTVNCSNIITKLHCLLLLTR